MHHKRFKMHNCLVCGGAEFEIQDGLYYCSVCQTQSQDIREEEDQEIALEDIREFRSVKERIKKDRWRPQKYGRRGRPATVSVPPRPWRTCEGFTILLREQVRALIRLGASPSIKDTVFKLWALYLSKTGYAFNSIVPPEERLLPLRRTQRDSHVLSLSDPNRPFEQNRSRMPDVEPTKETSLYLEKQKKAKRKVLSRRIENENLHRRTPVFNSLTQVHKNRLMHYSENMTMKCCSMLPFVALLYTHNMTILADYVRWIEQGLIPYEALPHYFPPDMKFSHEDYRVFEKPKLGMGCEQLRFLAGFWHDMLCLPPLPVPSIQLMCSRFIVQLSLPQEFHAIVSVFLADSPYTQLPSLSVDRALVSNEVFAMAVIVIVLKLFFGLDGHKEVVLSQYAKQVNSVNKPGAVELRLIENHIFRAGE